MMRYHEGQNKAAGIPPESGAIFLCGSATGKECLKRRLFALPSSFCQFVRQVKSGMILFLFQTETRKLHGVFQACSDGTVNGVANAFSSSGKQFPAQVEVTRIWDCNPLHEDEFREAIRDNYFTKYKFSLGLSEAQVRRLLSLFNLKKLNSHSRGRTLSKADVASPLGYLANDHRRPVSQMGPQRRQILTKEIQFVDHALDFTANFSRDAPRNRRAVGNYESLMTNPSIVSKRGVSSPHIKYTTDTFCDPVRGTERGRVGVSNRVGDEPYLDTNAGMGALNVFSGHSSHDIRRVPDGMRYETIDNVESGYNEKDTFAPVCSAGYPASWLKHNLSADHSVLAVGADTVVRGQHVLSSDLSPSGNHNLRSLPCYRDATITSTCPYESDWPSNGFSDLPYFGISRNSETFQAHEPLYNSYQEVIISPPSNKICHPFMEQDDTKKILDFSYGSGDSVNIPSDRNHGLGDCAPNNVLLSSNLKKYSDRNSMLGGICSGDVSPNSYAGRVHGVHSSQLLLQDLHASSCVESPQRRCGVSYLHSSSRNHSPLYDLVSQDKVGHLMAVHEYNDAVVTGSVNPEGWKNGSSVFSRLNLGFEVSSRQADAKDVDNSVDEVMMMLHQCRDRWTRTRKARPTFGVPKGFGRSWTRKFTTSASDSPEADSMIDVNINDVSAGEANESQTGERTPLLNFKRRSEAKKASADNQTFGCSQTSMDAGSPSGQHKRRKLIRPNFSAIEPSKATSSNDKITPEHSLVSSQICGRTNEVVGRTGTSVTCCAEENKACPMFQLSDIVHQIGFWNEKTTTATQNENNLEALNCESSGVVHQIKSGDETNIGALNRGSLNVACQTSENDGGSVKDEEMDKETATFENTGDSESLPKTVATQTVPVTGKEHQSQQGSQTALV